MGGFECARVYVHTLAQMYSPFSSCVNAVLNRDRTPLHQGSRSPVHFRHLSAPTHRNQMTVAFQALDYETDA